MTKDIVIRATVDALIKGTNAFDTEGVLALFTPRAVIDDPSTGECFKGHAGIRDYMERFFIGYRTVTRLLSIDIDGGTRARVRVDFTGDFGHEIGILVIAFSAAGLIIRVDADLE